MLTPSPPTDRAISVPLQIRARPPLPRARPASAHSLVTSRVIPAPVRYGRLDPTHLPPALPFSGPQSALVLPPALRPPGRPARHWRAAAALLLQAARDLPSPLEFPWGRAVRLPLATLSPPPPAGLAPSRPAGRARQRVRERSPAHRLGVSPRWPTCPQRRPGAGPRSGAGVASASGPAPPLAVPAPSWPACRARHLGPRAVPPPASSFPALRPARPPTAAPPPWVAVSRGEGSASASDPAPPLAAPTSLAGRHHDSRPR